jgi:hypothetical protein
MTSSSLFADSRRMVLQCSVTYNFLFSSIPRLTFFKYFHSLFILELYFPKIYLKEAGLKSGSIQGSEMYFGNTVTC